MAAQQEHKKTSSAERMRRYRKRKRQGVICIVRVPIYQVDTEALVTRNLLTLDQEKDPAQITEAIEALVVAFTQGELVAVNPRPVAH